MAQSVKQAKFASDLSPFALNALLKRGAMPLDTRHGCIAVGYIFHSSDEFPPWIARFNSTKYDPVFAGLDAEGLKGVSKRSLNLDPSFSPKKIRFKTNLEL